MFAIKTIRLLHLLSYLIITTQLMYYLFLMGDALKLVHIDNFLEQRQVVDRLIQQRHVPVYYVCLALSILMVGLHAKQWCSPVFISSALALTCLIVDVTIARGEVSNINNIVNSHPAGAAGIDWQGLRLQWLHLIKVRGIFSTAGFVFLLIGLLWQKP